MHYLLWHELRTFWLGYPEDARQKIRELGWEPPRPAVDERGREITDNGSGEDYLYMHCELIGFANHILAGVRDPNYPRVEGWVTIPPPGDPDFPVPPAWFSPEAPKAPADVNNFIARSKSDEYFERRFRYWEGLCTDPFFLRRVSLGELGTLIEQTLHDGMGSRWASAPGAWRPDFPPPGETIPQGWDDPGYDFLRDTYSKHVNPIFWKFYGWVQDRLEDWKVVNGVFGREFWNSTWVGKMPGDRQPGGRCPPSPREGPPLFAILDDDPEIAQEHVTEMEQVLGIIAETEASKP